MQSTNLNNVLNNETAMRWFGHVARKDDTDWVERCMTLEADGTDR